MWRSLPAADVSGRSPGRKVRRARRRALWNPPLSALFAFDPLLWLRGIARLPIARVLRLAVWPPPRAGPNAGAAECVAERTNASKRASSCVALPAPRDRIVPAPRRSFRTSSTRTRAAKMFACARRRRTCRAWNSRRNGASASPGSSKPRRAGCLVAARPCRRVPESRIGPRTSCFERRRCSVCGDVATWRPPRFAAACFAPNVPTAVQSSPRCESAVSTT